MIPDAGGDGIAGAVLGLGPTPDLVEPTLWTSAGLPDRLPPGTLPVRRHVSAPSARRSSTLGWEYGSLSLHPLSQSRRRELPSLVAPAGADLEYVRLASEALGEARDLINTPANDLGPAELGEAVQRLALQHEAECRIIVGEELLRQNYPLIYEVGKGSAREPRLIDMRWGKRGAPRVTLVGKGVCFDTGGLDIKPSSGMLLMKKDMGGAALRAGAGAHAHGCRCARAVAAADSGGGEQRLRPLLPARATCCARARDSPSRSAIPTPKAGWCWPMRWPRPTRSSPALLIDLATLTGAARVALGPGTAGYLLDSRRSWPSSCAQIGEREARSAVAHAAVERLRR